MTLFSVRFNVCNVAVIAMVAMVAFDLQVASALADDIQMIPPVNPGTEKPTDCIESSSFSHRVLTWDGKTGIKCSSKFKIDNNGGIQTNSVVIKSKASVGGACSPEGKIVQSSAASGVLLSCQSGKWQQQPASVASGTLGGSCGTLVPVYPAIKCHDAYGGVCGPHIIGISECAEGWSLVAAGGGLPCQAIMFCMKD
ncbi:MAG: hypothetical protein WC464_08460 [Bdellovibrionales bacterium]